MLESIMSGSNSQENDSPGSLLRGGEFYSPVESRLCTEDVLLSELRQPCPRKVPRHEHELAYVTVVLQGDCLEGDRGKLEDLCALTAAFNPAGVQHETVIGPSGASFFTIELRDQRLKDLGVRLPAQTKFDRGSGAMLLPGLRMYLALKTQTSDAVLLESDVLELLAAIAGFSSGEKTAPRWLGRVKERMHEEFSDKIRMCDLADEAGVHPVHLARAFRRTERLTPGEYLQRLRVRAACHKLHDAEYPLAAIAMECGFADQSHLTRIFRKFTKTTPEQFRRTLRSH
jgi:AraC family transcriptional regulator